MYLSGTTHNDLHTKNIFIVDVEPCVVNYYIEGEKFSFIMTKKVLVYDYDYSYCQFLGNNYWGGRCKSVRNEVLPHTDMLKVASCILIVKRDEKTSPPDGWSWGEFPIKKQLLDIFIPPNSQETNPDLVTVYNMVLYDGYLRVAEDKRYKAGYNFSNTQEDEKKLKSITEIDKYNYSLLNSPFRILQNVYSHIDKDIPDTLPIIEYRMNSDMFHSNGLLVD